MALLPVSRPACFGRHLDSGCSSKADIGALEMFVYSLKSNRILRIFKHFFQCLQYYLSIETKVRWKIDR